MADLSEVQKFIGIHEVCLIPMISESASKFESSGIQISEVIKGNLRFSREIFSKAYDLRSEKIRWNALYDYLIILGCTVLRVKETMGLPVLEFQFNAPGRKTLYGAALALNGTEPNLNLDALSNYAFINFLVPTVNEANYSSYEKHNTSVIDRDDICSLYLAGIFDACLDIFAYTFAGLPNLKAYVLEEFRAAAGASVTNFIEQQEVMRHFKNNHARQHNLQSGAATDDY